MTGLKSILSLNDLEEAARRHLPRPIFGYVAGAAEEGQSLRANRAAFEELSFVPRSLRDTSQRSQEVELLGVRYASPFGIAPMGLAALSGYRGDLALARAAQRQKIPAVMSGFSLIPMEEVAQANPDMWYQAYLPGETNRIDQVLARVERAGFRTLMVTVDVSVPANRENNQRAGFSAPLRPSLRLAWDGAIRPHWLFGTFLRTIVRHGMPHFPNAQEGRGPSLISSKVGRETSRRDLFSWQHIEYIRERWKGRLVVKGILNPEDALHLKTIGCDAVVLSNHGGRQLDGAVSALHVLAPTVEAVGPDFPILIDGGFRRGSDVLKALALGARMVLVGRPFNYAVSIAGEAGVQHAISILRTEVDRNLALIGANACAELSPQHLLRLR